MTPDQIKDARQSLGLTQAQLAALLDTDAQSVRRMEMPDTASTHRKAPPRAIRLLKAYLDGHRPDDWPNDETAGDITERAITKGYIIALSMITALHDEPDIAADALVQLGLKPGEIKKLGLDEFDMANLEKMAEGRKEIWQLI